MRAAEEGQLARPVPFLVMQTNGKDVACAYVVDDDTEKAKTPDAASPAAASSGALTDEVTISTWLGGKRAITDAAFCS